MLEFGLVFATGCWRLASFHQTIESFSASSIVASAAVTVVVVSSSRSLPPIEAAVAHHRRSLLIAAEGPPSLIVLSTGSLNSAQVSEGWRVLLRRPGRELLTH